MKCFGSQDNVIELGFYLHCLSSTISSDRICYSLVEIEA